MLARPCLSERKTLILFRYRIVCETRRFRCSRFKLILFLLLFYRQLSNELTIKEERREIKMEKRKILYNYEQKAVRAYISCTREFISNDVAYAFSQFAKLVYRVRFGPRSNSNALRVAREHVGKFSLLYTGMNPYICLFFLSFMFFPFRKGRSSGFCNNEKFDGIVCTYPYEQLEYIFKFQRGYGSVKSLAW